jgi:hypothetical protein
MLRLSREARDCYACAEDCRLKAAEATTDRAREDFLRLEHHWLTLARNYEFLEQLGLFTVYNNQRRRELSQNLDCFDGLFETGKSLLIDGKHRPAPPGAQAIASPTTDDLTRVESQPQSDAANSTGSDRWMVQLVEVCATAGVQLLRYPVCRERQAPGQTMATGALSQCLRRYGKDTLITALQCVTQTTNNKPGALTARIIKSLCSLLAGDPALRDSGLALLDRFDRIDLIALSNEAVVEANAKKTDAVETLCLRLRRELEAQIADGKLAAHSSMEPATMVNVTSHPLEPGNV